MQEYSERFLNYLGVKRKIQMQPIKKH